MNPNSFILYKNKMSPKEREKLEQERITIQKQIDDIKNGTMDVAKLKLLLKDRESIDFRLSLW